MSIVTCACCKRQYRHVRDFAEQGVVEGHSSILDTDYVWITCGHCSSTAVFQTQELYVAMFIKDTKDAKGISTSNQPSR